MDNEQLEQSENGKREPKFSGGVFPRNQEVLRAIEKQERNFPRGVRGNDTALDSRPPGVDRADLIRRQRQKEARQTHNQQPTTDNKSEPRDNPDVLDLDEYKNKKEVRQGNAVLTQQESGVGGGNRFVRPGGELPQKTSARTQENTEQKEISITTLILMVGVAIFYDVFQLIIEIIPLVGQILSLFITLFAFLTFYVWFKIKGRSFASPKRAMAMGAGVIIEIIPILNILPGWTVAVLFLVGIERVEKIARMVPGGGVATKALNTANKVGGSSDGVT